MITKWWPLVDICYCTSEKFESDYKNGALCDKTEKRNWEIGHWEKWSSWRKFEECGFNWRVKGRNKEIEGGS